MKQTVLLRVVPWVLAVVGAGVFLLWWSYDPRSALQERVPGQDGTSGGPGAGGAARWEGQRVPGPGVAPTNFTGAWPWFRGPNLNGISPDPTPLARSWPASGPPLLWQITVDEGYAGAAIRQGRVFLTDYDPTNSLDAIRCLSLADGRELWRYTYPVKIKRYHGRTRTVPAVTEKHLVSFGPKCHVVCLDPLTGEYRWHLNLVREFGATVPEWYAGQCPLVDGDRLILGTGGDALVVAVELATGKTLWKSPNPNKWAMTHNSITPVEFAGRRMYVYCASGGVAAVAAEDGRILWEYPDWRITMANIPAPVHVGEGHLFLSGGYGAGSLMMQMKETDGRLAVQPLFRLKPNVFGSTQHTPILHRNHLFGVRPEPDQQLVCLDLSGKIVWASGSANKFGKGGPYLIAQDMIFVLDDDGLLTLAEASTAGFHKLAQARVLHGHDAWAPMALADGRLIVRDLTQMVCLDVSAK